MLHGYRGGDEASRPAGVMTVHFLLTLLACEGNFVCIDDHDEVSHVLRSVVDGFVLTHNHFDYLGRKPACYLTLCIHIPPPPKGCVPFHSRMASVQHRADNRGWYCTLRARRPFRQSKVAQSADRARKARRFCRLNLEEVNIAFLPSLFFAVVL